MINDLFCPKFHTCCISLVKTHHSNFSHFTVKGCRIDVHKRPMQSQSPASHKFQSFPITADRFLQMIQIVRNGKFNTFNSHSCLTDDFLHLIIRQKMTDIYHDYLPLNITFAGLCYQSKDRLSVISDTSGVHPEMPVILL